MGKRFKIAKQSLTSKRLKLSKQSSTGSRSVHAVSTELFTDGTGNEDEIGILTATDTLSGSGTYLTDKTFSGTITMDDVELGGLQHKISIEVISLGALELDMALATEFFFTHNDDIVLNFTNVLSANASVCVLTRFKDSSGIDREIDFSSTTINGAQATVKFSDDATPILTQTDDAIDKLHITIKDTTVIITLSANLRSSGTAENTSYSVSNHLYVAKTTTDSPEAPIRLASHEIQVEGATTIGALNVFGSTATAVKSSNVRLIGNNLSECDIGNTIDKNSTFTNTALTLNSDTLTIDLSKSVFMEVEHDRDFSLAFTNLKSGGAYMARVDLIRKKDSTSSATVRNISFDNTTVNGTLVSVLWEDGQEVSLSQEPDAITNIMFGVFENTVEVKLFDDYRVGGT